MSKLVKAGIYTITHEDGRVYVGSSYWAIKRLAKHRYELRHNKHCNAKLQNAWNKYGEHSFKTEIVERVEDRGNLIEREQYWIDKLKAVSSGFNIAPIAGSTVGLRVTDEQKAILSKTHKGKKLTPEHIAILRAVHTGRKHSEETKKKMSEASKRRNANRPPSPPRKPRLKNKTGIDLRKHKTPEHIEKIAAAKRGKKRSPESIAKTVAGKAGFKHSEETKKRMSEAKKGMIFSDERKANMAAAARARWARQREASK